MRLVCAWCDTVIQTEDGRPPLADSHGLCLRCSLCERRYHPDICDCADGLARRARVA